MYFRNARRNRNEERRVNAETFGLQYRAVQHNSNQRFGYRRNNNNNTRYQRNYGGRNDMFYGNANNRVRAY